MTNELIMTNHVNSSKLMLKTDHLAKNLYHYKKKGKIQWIRVQPPKMWQEKQEKK